MSKKRKDQKKKNNNTTIYDKTKYTIETKYLVIRH